MQLAQDAKFLNEYEQPIGKHYIILGMSWAGWLFDFYDLILFSFLTIPIQKSLGLSSAALSFIIGASLAAITWYLTIRGRGESSRVVFTMLGIFAMLSGLVSSKHSPRWWVFLLEGIVSVAAGVFAILRPGECRYEFTRSSVEVS